MRVCVIGAGASGLTSIKACKEENVDVVCYEKSSSLGGLWRYDASSNKTTVTRSTITNASKEMSSFSDFPAPSDLPNYLHHPLMVKYLESYAEKFDLAKHIQYKSEVVQVSPVDQTSSARWSVSVRNLDTNEIESKEFDSIMVCIGNLNRPFKPTFKGQEKFKGKIMHAQVYKKPDGFEGKRVCIVGFGNSAADCAVDLSLAAEKVFLSTRQGGWVLSRLAPSGQPVDLYLMRRFSALLFRYLPTAVTCALIHTIVQRQFDHRIYGLRPDYPFGNAIPVVNDDLANRLISGTVTLKGDIERFEEDGVVFKGETVVQPVDQVILATGYELDFPFLSEQIIRIENNRPSNLYKMQYAPETPHTLAFIGMISPNGPVFPVSEMQARWHLQLLTGKCKRLPAYEQMLNDIEQSDTKRKMQFRQSKRHTIGVDFLSYIEEVASQFDAKPSLFKLFFTDPMLWYYCVFKPSLPYQYRLQGPNSNYQKARDTILTYQQRVHQAFRTREFNYESSGWFSRMVDKLLTILVEIIL